MQPSRSARQKRGVSEIVATVLIIMIVVAAVGILWVAVIPMIKNSLGSSDCSKADVSIVSDSVYTCYRSNNITMVQIKKGTSEVNVSKLIFYLSSGGNTVKYSKNVLLSAGGLSAYSLNSSKLSVVDRIGIVPVVGKKECSAVYAESVTVCGSEEIVGPIINDTCATETCVGKCGTVGECSCGQNCLAGQSCESNVCIGIPAAPGTAGNPYQINNWSDLNLVRNNLNSYYVLNADLSSSSVGYLTRGDAWVSIGGTFSGNFNGGGHTISDLKGESLFFDISGTIVNIGLLNLSVNGPSFSATGGLARISSGMIYNCYVVGKVAPGLPNFNNAGGLVGNQSGGVISNSYFVGNISGFSNSVGGLVGVSYGIINGSYVGGNISGTSNYFGGLVGQQIGGIINNSYSTANVLGGWHVGGLVGYQQSGMILNSYATGNITSLGAWRFGGLVGQQESSASISNCYSTGSVVDTNGGSGGLVGIKRGTLLNVYWYNRSQGVSCWANGTTGFASNNGCVAIPSGNLAYFYNYENAPMNLTAGTGWNFVNTWSSLYNGTQFPTLR